MTKFLHAKDYLIELASKNETAGWMHDLIVRLINKDGELTEEDYAAAAQQLKTNDAATMELPTADTTANETEIRLVSLTHHTGVNASGIRGMGSGGQELLYTLSAQYIDLWSSFSLQGIARASSDSALASFVTSLKNRYPCVA